MRLPTFSRKITEGIFLSGESVALFRNEEYDYEQKIGNGTVITNQLRIRSGAGTEYDIVGQAENKKTYPVYEVRKSGKYTWYMIDYNQWISDQNGKWVTYTPNEPAEN